MRSVTLVCLLVLLGLLTGCGRGPGTSVQIKGSDTMVNLAQAWAQAYQREHPQANLAVTGGGSGVGIAALISGTTDIADASREMSPQEIAQAEQHGITPQRHEVALDALSVIVNPSNRVSRLTIPQLSGIFTGRLTNWKEVGGLDQPIVVLSRDRNSGTHVFFLEQVVRQGNPRGTQEYGQKVLMLPSNQAIADEVAGNRRAIGYVGLGYYDPARHKALAVAKSKDGPYVAPSADAVHNHTYPIARPLLMYTRQQPRPEVASFVAFARSPQGQQIVRRLDFVSLQ